MKYQKYSYSVVIRWPKFNKGNKIAVIKVFNDNMIDNMM